MKVTYYSHKVFSDINSWFKSNETLNLLIIYLQTPPSKAIQISWKCLRERKHPNRNNAITSVTSVKETKHHSKCMFQITWLTVNYFDEEVFEALQFKWKSHTVHSKYFPIKVFGHFIFLPSIQYLVHVFLYSKQSHSMSWIISQEGRILTKTAKQWHIRHKWDQQHIIFRTTDCNDFNRQLIY
jgi:hypothetical protein